MPKKTKAETRLDNALNKKPKKERLSVNIEEADNGYVVTVRKDDDYENIKRVVAKTKKEAKEMAFKLL